MQGPKTSLAVPARLPLDGFVPVDHPIRIVRRWINHALAKLDAKGGDGPVTRAAVLQLLHGIRSDRRFIEQLNYSLLFRWFVELDIGMPMLSETAYLRERQRLLAREDILAVMNGTIDMARSAGLLAADHFRPDIQLLQWWLSGAAQEPIRSATPPTA